MTARVHFPGEFSLEPQRLQLAVESMPSWVGDGDGGRFRPAMCVVVDATSALCLGMDIAKPGVADLSVAVDVLSKVLAMPGRPARLCVEVRDPELATALTARPEFAAAGGVAFECADSLPVVDELLSHMWRDMFAKASEPPLVRGGLTVERLRDFADACARFHAAAPWRHLHDDDLIVIGAPKPPAAMGGVSILGAGGQVVGLAFFPDERTHDRVVDGVGDPLPTARHPRWSLMFHAPDELPPEDADLWQEHGLPVAADDSAPVLFQYHGKTKVTRPDGATLTFVEGMCRALAATTEQEIDAGRWEKTVETFDGPARFSLSIPHLLRPRQVSRGPAPGRAAMEQSMRQIVQMLQGSGARSIDEMNAILDAQVNGRPLAELPAGPRTDRERAQDLCDESQGQRSRRALQMLREALQLDPDCTDAYVLLARRHADPAEAEPLYRRAIEAGRRSLGAEPFDDPRYPFWGAIESRPFMRAMAGLGDVLRMQGRLAEAADVCREMLRLNPGDNQGIRYTYVPLLVALGELDAARDAVESEAYRDDICALWDYSAALIAFRQARSADADRSLKSAMSKNPAVARLILEPDLAPPISPETWTPGGVDEAMMVADALGEVWRADSAATHWLHGAATKPAARRRKSSVTSRPKRNTKRKRT